MLAIGCASVFMGDEEDEVANSSDSSLGKLESTRSIRDDVLHYKDSDSVSV